MQYNLPVSTTYSKPQPQLVTSEKGLYTKNYQQKYFGFQ